MLRVHMADIPQMTYNEYEKETSKREYLEIIIIKCILILNRLHQHASGGLIKDTNP